jgi:pimeloyl-ACP methyl ester carboxylesterase
MPKTAGLYYSLFSGGQPEQKPIVLIHGAGSSHLSWPAELRRLTGRTVLCLDLPGHGKSEGVGCQSVGAYCGALIEFLAALGMYQAIFVGHSLGGAIALNMAVDFPQHVAGLGLISSGAFFNPPPYLLEYLANPVTTAVAIQALQERSLSARTNADLAARSLQTLKATRPSVLYGDWLACAQFDLRERMAEIGIPVYIACGAEDKLVPASQSRYLAEHIPDTRLTVLPGAGHLALIEEPATVARGLGAYLDDIECQASGYTLPVKALEEHKVRGVNKD